MYVATKYNVQKVLSLRQWTYGKAGQLEQIFHPNIDFTGVLDSKQWIKGNVVNFISETKSLSNQDGSFW